MSQSKSYSLFRIYGYTVTKTKVEDQTLYTFVEPQPHRICCSNCKSRDVIRRGSTDRAKIEAVAMDLSRAFQKAVEDNLPDAAIIFDRFHIVKLYDGKLTALPSRSSSSGH